MNTPPVLATIPDRTIEPGRAGEIIAKATDADGDTISYTWTRKIGETTPILPPGTALNRARLTFTPPNVGKYTMTVTASDGTGTDTEEVVITVLARPSWLTGLNATAGDGSVKLSWNDPIDASITRYEVAYWVGRVWSGWSLLATNASATEGIVGGLKNGSTYQFYVRAVNAAGAGGATDMFFTLPASVGLSPPIDTRIKPPKNLIVVPGAPYRLYLTWIADADTLRTGWRVRHQTRFRGSWSSWTHIPGNISSGTISYTMNDLRAGWHIVEVAATSSSRREGGSVFRFTSPSVSASPVHLLASIEFSLPSLTETRNRIMNIHEGSSASYRIRLTARPTTSMTLTPVISPDHTDVSFSPGILTFTTSNWNKYQTMTVSAGLDRDTDSDRAHITHTASGGGYPARLHGFDVEVHDTGSEETSLTLSTIADQWVKLGQKVDITAKATDGDSNTIVYAWTRKAEEMNPPLPSRTALNQARLTFTPPGTGTYTMTVTASDANGDTDSEEVVITVENAATVSVPATLSVTEGTDNKAVVTVIASEVFGEAVTLNVAYGGAATGAAIPANGDYDNDAVGSVSFNATELTKDITIPITDDSLDEDAETFTVTISGTLPNGFTLGNASTTVTINDDDESPELAALTAQTVKVGEVVDITASATDGDGDTVSFTWTRKNGETTPSLPPGTVLNQARLTFTTVAVGTYTMTVTVSDGTNTDTGEVVITVEEPPAVTVSTSSLTVAEGGFGTYTVKLDTQPSDDVTVTVGGIAGDVTVDKSSLTFTPQNYGTAQEVTVSAASDPDANTDPDVTLTHSASGGGYGSVSIDSVVVSITESDTKGVTVSTGMLTVAEGRSGTYTVKLDTQPSANVTVTLRGASGDVTVDKATLTFTPQNYSTAQTVTVSAASDLDTNTDPDVTLTHSASGGGYGSVSIDSVVVSVTEDDTKGVTLSTNALTVAEGGRGSYTVKLDTRPSATVTVTIGGTAGDVTVDKASLTFTTQNYATAQTVTVSAGQDNDADTDPDVTLTHTASGGGYGSVSVDSVVVSVTERDTKGVTISTSALTVEEGGSNTYTVKLDTRPSANVTVTVGGASGEVTLAGSPLTFTSNNYSTPQTVTVRAGVDEDATDDTATLIHTASGGGYGSVGIDDIDVTVTDTTPTLQLLTDPADITEGSNISLTITSDKVQTGNLSVSLTLANRDASGFDADDIPGTLGPRNFTAVFGSSGSRTATVTIPTGADSTAEDVEEYQVTLNDAPGYVVGVDSTANATLYDGARPAKPTGFSAERLTGEMVTLSWNYPRDSSIVKWQFRILTEGYNKSWVSFPLSDAYTTTGAVDLSSPFLNYAKPVSFQVRAVNSNGGGPASDTATVPGWTAGVTISESTLTVAEGSSRTYTVKLNTKPSGNVTVIVGGASGEVTVRGSPLRFNRSNWRTPQTVTVSADVDEDTTDDTTTLTHTARGRGYRSVSIDDVSVTVTDTTPTLQLLTEPADVTEGSNIDLTITSDKAQTGNLSVSLTLADRDASGFDADDIPGTLGPRTFTAVFGNSASMTATVAIPTSADSTAEGTDTYRITLNDGPGYAPGLDRTADGTLNDLAATGTVSVPSTLSVTEGTDANAVVTVTTTAAFGKAVTLNVAYGGGATGASDPSDGDYDNDAVTLVNFNATDLTKDITIPITDDALDEDTETITVTISGALPNGFTLGNARSTVTINDDDASPVLASLTAQTVTVGQTVDITARATDTDDGDTISYVWKRKDGETTPALPDGTDLNAARLTFTAVEIGTYTMTVTASDGTNTDTGEVVITVTASPAVTVSTSALTIAEGSSGTYTVKLDTRPSANVTVTVGGTAGDVTVDKAFLTFTPQNYATAQTVTVSAGQDDDGDTDPDVTLTHSAAGGGYGSVSIDDVLVSITEDDTKGVTVSTGTLTVAEGGSGTYTVKLDTKPSDDVTVTVGGASGDVTLDTASLTFTPQNYDTAQTVTVAAGQDDDGDADPDVTLTHTAAGGGYGSVSINSVVVSVTEDDTKGVTVSTGTLTVTEGGSGSYTVKLDTQPSANVTVTVGGTAGDVTVDKAFLTFTPQNYSTAQIVTVSAGQDNDADTDPDVTLTHSASGGGYGSVSINSVVVSVTEDDTKGVTVSTGTLTVAEGGSGTYTVKLDTRPSANVTVTVGGTSGDVTVDKVSLTFTPQNYATAQTVTVSAGQDNDADTDPDVTLTHSASGGGYGSISIDSVVVSITESDTKGVTVSTGTLTVAESSSGTYTVKLDTKPSANVTVTVGGTSGDVTVDKASLTFTPQNYDTAQTVTVAAGQDDDGDADPDVTLTHTAAGGGYGSVSINSVVVSVTEDDTKGVTVSTGTLTVTEGGSGTYTVKLDTRPSANVTVTVGGTSGDVTVDKVSLTFTPQNYATAQTVTVSAGQDNDADTDPDVTLTHSASGGGYGSVSINSVVVSITESDTKGVTVSTGTLTVAEGGSGTYTVKLDTRPSANVTVTVGGTSGDVTVDKASLTFTPQNYTTAQTVTVSAASDPDADTDPDVTLTHTAAGGGYGSASIDSVVVSITESDTKGVTISPNTLTVAEGSSGTYTVKLDTQPSANVRVTVGGTSGDVTVRGSPLRFTRSNWSTAQIVTVDAGADEDTTDDTATLTHRARGGGYGSVDIDDVRVTVTDTTPTLQLLTDPASVTEGSNISLTVTSDKTQTGNLSVSLTLADRDASGFDADDIPGTLGPRTFTAVFGNSASRTGTVTIPTSADSTAEGADTYRITLNDGPGYAPGLDRTADGTLNDPAPTGTVSVPTALSVTEGTEGNAVVRVTTTAGFGKAVTLNVAYGGAATGAALPANGDYDNDAATTVSFSATELTKDITIPITDDSLDEDAETFTVTISGTLPNGFTLGNASTTVTINDDDETPELAALTARTVKVGQQVDITAKATDGDNDPISYAWTRKDGETSPALPDGTDLNAARLTFTPPDTGTYTMTVTASDGTNTDTEELVITVGMASTVSVPTTLAVTEGTDSTAVVRITASEAFGETVTINVAYGGGATGASDPSEGDYDNDAVASVSFSSTDLTKDISIPITDDALDEDAETFTVTISGTLPSGFTLGNASTTVTITDDDESPELAALTARTVKVGQVVDVTASATDGDGDTITYTWTRKVGETTPPLPDGTALNAARLTFTPPDTGTYTMTVTASDGTNTDTGVVVITVGTGATVSVPTALAVTEGTDSNATVTVTASAAFGETVSITVTYEETSATGATDPANGDYDNDAVTSVSFNATDLTKDITIPITDDALDEDAETFTVTISGTLPAGFTLGNASTTVTITDNDASPVLEPLTGQAVAVGEDVDLTASAADADNDPISYTWMRKDGETEPALPDGTDLHAARLTFTPTETGTYTMTVTASDGNDNTDTAEVVITVGAVTLDIPARPTRFRAKAGNGQVVLSWNDPDNSSITGWQMRHGKVGESWNNWSDIDGSDARTTSHTVTGLDNDVRYRFRIRAKNDAGAGTRSTVRQAMPTASSVSLDIADVTAAENEAFVFTVTASPVPSSEVRFRYTVTAASGDTATAGVDFTEVTTPTGATIAANTASTMITVSVLDDDLVENDETFTVTLSEPSDGATLGDAAATGTITDNDGSDGAPLAVTGFTATPGVGSVTLSWNDPADPSITGWQYRYRVVAASLTAPRKGATASAPSGRWMAARAMAAQSTAAPLPRAADWSWIDIPDSGANTTSYTVTGLTPGRKYQFQVRAWNAAGFSEESSLPVATATPWAPDSGGGGGYTVATVRGVTLSESGLRIPEGGSGSYTVVLDERPSGDVSITVSSPPGDVSVTGTPLTFTRSNWDEPQTVTVRAAEDPDAVPDRAILTHRASGGGYDSVNVDAVEVRIADDDTAAVTATPTLLELEEGRSASTTVALDSEPTEEVTVTVTGAPDDITMTPSALTFTASNWNRSQTVTVKAEEDADAVADTATLTLQAAGGEYDDAESVTVAVRVTDNDTAGVTVTPTELELEEGTSATYTVVLDSEPTEEVTVTVTGAADDITVAPTSVTFTAANWDRPQTVTVEAGEDDDAVADAATLTLQAAGGEYDDAEMVTVAVRVIDNDTAGVTVTPTELTVDEGASAAYTVALDTEPVAPVTVTPTSSNPRAATVSGPLVFTATDWSVPQTVTVTGAVDEESTEDIAATVNHAIAGGDYGEVVAEPVAVTVRDTTLAKVLERANRVNEVLLPQVAATVASQSVRAVADRIDAVGSGQLANAFNVTDPMSASGDPMGVSHPGVRARLGMGSESRLRAEAGELVPPMRDVLNGATFNFGLGQQGDDDSPFPQVLGLWGRGDLVTLSGSDRAVAWNGELWSAHFGVDTRIGSSLLAGVAVSHATGRFSATSDGEGGPVEGLHKTGLTSAHPYLAWLSQSGSHLWVSGGYGTGNARVKERGRTGRSAGLSFATGSAGGLGALFTAPGSFGGTMRLAIRGEGSWAQLGNDAENGLKDLEVRVVRGRVALEGSLEHPVGTGTVTPAVEIGVRYDRGDAAQGAGLEAGGSLAWQAPDRGLTVEIRGRALLTHEQDRNEWGVGAVVRLDPGEDARGAFLTLTPAQGGVESGVGQMFDRHNLIGSDAFGPTFRAERRLEAEGGYGVGLGAGALAPYAGLTSSEMRRQWRIGTRYRLGQGFLVGLEGAHEDNPYGAPVRRLTLEGMLTWGSSPASGPSTTICHSLAEIPGDRAGSRQQTACPDAHRIEPPHTMIPR